METGSTARIRTDVLSRLGLFHQNLQAGEGFGNRYWAQSGRTFRELAGEQWLARIHPDDRAQVEEQLNRHVRNETPEFRAKYRLIDGDGTCRWFVTTGVVEQRDEQGWPLVYVGVDVEVTEIHRLREELEQARSRAEERTLEADVLRGAGAVVVSSLDAEAAVRSVIDQLGLLVPLDSAFVCELRDRELTLVGGTHDVTEDGWRNFSRNRLPALHKVIASRAPVVIATHPVTSSPDPSAAAGTPAAGRALMVPLISRGSAVGLLFVFRTGGDFDPDAVRAVVSMADYLALALSNARLYSSMQERAEIDQLSGVLTRRAYLEIAERIVDESFHHGRPLCCLMVDIDHFKSINDTYGHLAGDQAIRSIGSILREQLRSTDRIGRYGGEEFSAILPDTELETGLAVAERLRAVIEATGFPGIDRKVTASIGVNEVPKATPGTDGSTRLTVEQIMKRADEALFDAKRRGRNRVVPNMTAQGS